MWSVLMSWSCFGVRFTNMVCEVTLGWATVVSCDVAYHVHTIYHIWKLCPSGMKKTIDVNPTFTLKSKIKMNQTRVLLSKDLLNCIFMLWAKRFWRSSHVSNWPLPLRYIQDPSSCSTASGSCWWCAAYVRPTTYSTIYIYIYRHILGPMVSTSVTDNICIKNLMFEQFAVKKNNIAWSCVVSFLDNAAFAITGFWCPSPSRPDPGNACSIVVRPGNI